MSTVAKTSIQINTAQATAALKTLNVNLTATLGGFEGLERALKENTAALRSAKTAGNNYVATQKTVNATARQGQSAFAGLKSKVLGLVAAYASLQSAQKFIQAADDYTNTTARLNVMNDGLQTTDELYQKIYQSAQRAKGGFNETAASIAKLGIVAGESFKSNDEIIAFIETFNKAAAVSGASTTETANAMYQLSQAFASGRLQGDELRSVRENAPMLFKAIQKELEAQYGKGVDFKKLAADGLISPDVIKAAAFKSAGEINKAFKSMPLTFGQTMTQAFNKVKVAMAPIFKDVQRIINNPAVQQGINTVVNKAVQGIYILWGAIKKVGSAIAWAAGVVWKFRWAILAVAGAVMLYRAVMLIHLAITKTVAFVSMLAGAAKLAFAGYTGLATMAVTGLNAAQLTSILLFLKVIAIILLIIGVIWAVIKIINYCCDTTISVCGVIFGAVMVLAAGIANIVMGVWNFILSILDNMVDPFIGIAEFIYNCFHGGFTGWMGAVQNLFGQLVSGLLATLKPLLEVWDMVFDTNAAATVTGWQNTAKSWGKTDTAANFDTGYLKKNFGASKESRFAYSDAWNYGYEKGEAFGKDPMGFLKDALGGALGLDDIGGIPSLDSLNGSLGSLGDLGSFGGGDDAIKKALGDIADNTGQTADNTGEKEDNYELLRDVMRQRAINRVGNSGGTVKIDMVNNNSLNSKLDIKSFLEQLAKTMEEAASTAAQGVHL